MDREHDTTRDTDDTEVSEAVLKDAKIAKNPLLLQTEADESGRPHDEHGSMDAQAELMQGLLMEEDLADHGIEVILSKRQGDRVKKEAAERAKLEAGQATEDDDANGETRGWTKEQKL